jgi:hypothetical protein
MPNLQDKKYLIKLKKIIADNFKAENWYELGILTNSTEIIDGHHRLLRSLSFGDEDYGGNVLDVLLAITDRGLDNKAIIEDYIKENFIQGIQDNIGGRSSEKERRITFAPLVFKVPEIGMENELVAAMMPFGGFDNVFTAMKLAVGKVGMRIERADTIWSESAFMQDIFNLIYR